MRLLRRWRPVCAFSGEDGGSCVSFGEISLRSVGLSFDAKGGRILSSPAMRGSSGWPAWLGTADLCSCWWSDGRQCGFLPLPFMLRGWLMYVQRNQNTRARPRCGLLQQFPRSWSPSAWRKDCGGLTGVMDDGGGIAGCVSLSFVPGCFLQNAGVYCVTS